MVRSVGVPVWKFHDRSSLPPYPHAVHLTAIGLSVAPLVHFSVRASPGQSHTIFNEEYHAFSVPTHWLHKALYTISAPQNLAVRFRCVLPSVRAAQI